MNYLREYMQDCGCSYELKLGHDNNLFVVFVDESDACKFDWLFIDLLGMRYASFGGMFNAFGYN